MISVDDDEDVTFHIPSPKVTTYGVSYNFRTPVSIPQLWTTEKDEDSQNAQDTEEVQDEELETIQVTLNAGIAGGLARPMKKVTIEYEDGTEGDESVCGTVNFGLDGWLTIF
jgi:DnaJ family protein C protein 11